MHERCEAVILANRGHIKWWIVYRNRTELYRVHIPPIAHSFWQGGRLRHWCYPLVVVQHWRCTRELLKEEDIYFGYSFNRILVFYLVSSRCKAAPVAYWTKPWSLDGCFDPWTHISNTTSRPASSSTKMYKETEREGTRGPAVTKDMSRLKTSIVWTADNCTTNQNTSYAVYTAPIPYSKSLRLT